MEKKNCSKKKIENYARLNFKGVHIKTLTFFLIRMIINENSLNEQTQKQGLETLSKKHAISFR